MRISSRTYHEKTSYQRHAMGHHVLDWANAPRLNKSYPPDLPVVFLPPTEPVSSASLWRLSKIPISSKPPGMPLLSTLLDLACGLTAKARQPSGDFYFRSAASAGALYPNEIYLLATGVDGLAPGVYHHDVFQRKLTAIRQGQFRHVAGEALPGDNRDSEVIFFITGIFNRSAWKYRERAYRYVLLDAGHVLENLILALAALHCPFMVGYDFVDDGISHLLGLDDQREVCLAHVRVAMDKQAENFQETTGKISILPESIRSSGRTAAVESAYPLITEMHHSGDLKNKHRASHDDRPKPLTKPWELKNPVAITSGQAIAERLSYPHALYLRRSKRNFIKKTLPQDHLMGLLSLLNARPGARDPAGGGDECLFTGFLAKDVEGLENGFYLCDFDHSSFGMAKSGNLQALMARVCLDQAWLAQAGLHFMFLADFHLADRLHGSRGYRYIMMEAGRMGQALYVGATALGLGCCGIGAFFDHEARDLLDGNRDLCLSYLVAVGPVKS